MDSYNLILLIALAVALAVWGITQFVFSRFSRDNHRIQSRLSSPGRNGVDALLKRPTAVQASLKGEPGEGRGACSRAWRGSSRPPIPTRASIVF